MSDKNEIKIRDADKQLTDEEYKALLGRWMAGDYRLWNYPGSSNTLIGDRPRQ